MRIIFILYFLFSIVTVKSQSCSSLNFNLESEIPSACNEMTMTMLHDQSNLPYLYVANKEAGLKIYNISNVNSPQLISSVNTSLFDSLDVMNLTQSGNYLYLALGNSFTNPQKCGMAIVDISLKYYPFVLDYFIVPNSSSGGGIVKVEGDYAYLGAMQSGLVILDISDKQNIVFKSQFIPDINFPPVFNPNPDTFNARGMEVKNGIVYLCYDAGGIRIIDCSDKSNPKETGRWCNPAMYIPMNKPKAYNNIILDDTLLYVAVDYCGLEILNVKDTGNITMLGWWNPYNCPNNNWFSSPVHANEIMFNKNCKQVYLSTGKSDMMVIDVSNPQQPDSCNFYGGVSNNLGTWGIGMWDHYIFLSYICVPWPYIPFQSDWTGVKIISFNNCSVGTNEITKNNNIIYPNPVSNGIISINKTFVGKRIKIINEIGCMVYDEIIKNDTPSFYLNKGIYLISINEQNQQITQKLCVN